MMSNKWAFSLTSLITIIALAFGVSPAMAADDFDATLSVDDISLMADSQSQRGVDIPVTLTFGEKVSLAEAQKAKISVRVEDTNGNETVSEITGDDATTGIHAKDIDPITTGNQFNGKTYTFTIPAASTPAGSKKIYLFIPAGVKIVDPGSDKSSKKGALTINLVEENPSASIPYVVTIATAPALLVPDAGFTGDSFDVVITLSEMPRENKLTKDHLAVDKGTAADPVYLGAIAPIDGKDDQAAADTPTGRDEMHHQYLVKITPKAEDGNLVVKVKEFEDNHKGDVDSEGTVTVASANKYTPPTAESGFAEGYDKLTVKIKKASTIPLADGTVLELPNKRVIPEDGYLVVAANPGATGIHLPKDSDADDNSPKAADRTPAEMKYNVIDVSLRDLEAFLMNGGTIDLVAPDAGIYISEIMWGTDASLTANSDSQWIEIKNDSGGELKTGDKTYKLIFYGPNETLPDKSVAANNIQDRVGTVDDNRVFWSITGKGQSGRSGHGESKGDLTAVVPTQELISMYRVAAPDAPGAPLGNTAAAWAQSPKPAVNIDGANRVGSPGDAVSTPFAKPTPPKDPPVVVTIPPAVLGDILVTEIMVDTGNGRLPQWIELANFSGKEVTLDGWSVEITNDADDADVERKVSIDLTGQTLDVREGANGTRGEALLLAAWGGRGSNDLSDRVLNVSSQLKKTGRYTLLSSMGFIIQLLPPLDTGVVDYSDEAGNLRAAEAWEIEMDENGRSSLIRVFDAGVAEDGEEADGWTLASSTSLLQTPASWYGSDEDAGTPGVIGGGPLPVELSHFRPARDKATGAVVITWATQSELNNAGFFIKRSQQRNGEFKVINATMVAGAGTTSEKQFYTYTDTTAQPNVVYYYQIEDVSLDGNRQTLTRGIRLKGHIGAAGKLTSTWGELKSSNE